MSKTPQGARRRAHRPPRRGALYVGHRRPHPGRPRALSGVGVPVCDRRLCVVEEDRQREDRLEPRALDAQKL